MELDKDQQELMFKFQMFEQQIQGLQQQLQAVEQAMNDMQTLHLGLEDLKGKTDQVFLKLKKQLLNKLQNLRKQKQK